MTESKYIYYKKGYKYQLVEDAHFIVDCYPREVVDIDFLKMTLDGELTIQAGYAWDGASGIAIDTKNFMRGSLVHDALYQLMRMSLMTLNERKDADLKLEEVCLEDGMWKVRTKWVYAAVRNFGVKSSLPKNKRETIKAP